MAAKKVKEDGKKHKAAIASSLTAAIYGLKVLDECIQDNKMNATRFIIVSGKRVFTSKAEKISICSVSYTHLRDDPATVYGVLWGCNHGRTQCRF